MTNLLRKFRIDFSAVIEVHGVNSLPSSQRYLLVHKVIPNTSTGACFSTYSIDKYRQLPTDDAENKNLDKRVSLSSRDNILSVCMWIQVDSFLSCVSVDPPSHSAW